MVKKLRRKPMESVAECEERMNLNQHAEIPTYEEFAHVWSRNTLKTRPGIGVEVREVSFFNKMSEVEKRRYYCSVIYDIALGYAGLCLKCRGLREDKGLPFCYSCMASESRSTKKFKYDKG